MRLTKGILLDSCHLVFCPANNYAIPLRALARRLDALAPDDGRIRRRRTAVAGIVDEARETRNALVKAVTRRPSTPPGSRTGSMR